ncbi:HlyD family secretion protein [Pedobacter nutrimenti]|uniref:HlyD family secretion protein n=1 Tax=Pedobacter nutrimenti TaxID=1241337 RepID=UPI00292D0489|nr:HlyD family efflux transporter periplasmic adaptor subunit [Pedobacter nutrimenti]
MKRLVQSLPLLLLPALISCNKSEDKYDASGTFEAVETIISAQASGTIKELNLEEGQTLQKGQTVGYIDSLQLYLKKQQLLAQVKATLSGKPNITAQTAALQEQLRQAQREQKRTSNLLRADAATQKQLDDANTQVDVVKKQISALQSSLGITSSSLTDQTKPLSVQIQQINDQLHKSKIVNEVSGTVLTKYAEVNEVTDIGKPIYKIAELNTIILRAYITGSQIPHIKVGQQVKVLVDQTKDTYKTYNGTIEWVSNKAEFTPKTIQTKDERANLVYAIKIRVKNDGFLKIGMYGDVKL